jgi:hypothetical protein
VVAATLESVFALCLGCIVFAGLMRIGVIPAAICERCRDPWADRPAETTEQAGQKPDNSALRRRSLVALTIIGIALIAMPGVFQLFDRAPKGATMISAFKPYMTEARLAGYQTELRQIDAGVRESNGPVAALLTGSSGPTADASFGASYPEFAAFEVLVLLGALRLRPQWWRTIRWVLAAAGIGLVVAPIAFQMFQRAPKGGRMVSAFTTIETLPRVQTIQGYFGEMAIGQGAIRLELVPALEKLGLSRVQVASQFPAVDTLDREWVHILNDLTPMIGAMSDNVGNYQAVAALPPFALFPWFFVLPGLITVGLVAAAGPRRRPDPTTVPPLRRPGGVLPEGEA